MSTTYEQYALVCCPCGRRVEMDPARVLRRRVRMRCMACGSAAAVVEERWKHRVNGSRANVVAIRR